MATFSDLSFRHRIFMKTYRYRTYDWSPGGRLVKPLQEASIALVTTAAFYLPEQEAFDHSARGGDFTYRIIPRNVELARLQLGHKSNAFDSSGIQADKNLALPLDRLEEMLQENTIGAVNRRHFSFMGSITAPGRLLTRTAPEVAACLNQDGVDGVLLTPV